MVFSLNLIWKLFSKGASLWVSWVQLYLLRKSSFWDFDENTSQGSWIWRKLLQLRPVASTMMRVQVHNGENTFFWHDNWLGKGKLWNGNNQSFCRELGVQRHGKIADIYSNGGWFIRLPRSQAARVIYNKVIQAPTPTNQTCNDSFLWKYNADTYKCKFSASCTWKLIRTIHPPVNWASIVWFPLSIPRQSFIVWMAMKNCLPTGDKLRTWGSQQPCVLCGEWNENREHLFFACPYSFQAWLSLTRNLIPSLISPDWDTTISTLSSSSLPGNDSLLLRLAFQSLLYAIWRERNTRIHKGNQHTFKEISITISKLILQKITASNMNQANKDRLQLRWENVWDHGQVSLVM